MIFDKILKNVLKAALENTFSTWGNLRDPLFLITCWCISQLLVAYGHSWWGKTFPNVEKLHFQHFWRIFVVLISFQNASICPLENDTISSLMLWFKIRLCDLSLEIWVEKLENQKFLKQILIFWRFFWKFLKIFLKFFGKR